MFDISQGLTKLRRTSWLACITRLLVGGTTPAHAQKFTVLGKSISMHGFFSQGYMKSDGNNFITAQTGDGTFAMTDGALNIATNLRDNFHIGAQVYSRNVGRLTNGQVLLDWAFADYRVRDWLGFRGGKVKTPLGRYNDNGEVSAGKTGSVAYQVYGGSTPEDKRSGYAYLMQDLGSTGSSMTGSTAGYDISWRTLFVDYVSATLSCAG
jgi:hypothetical protein